MAIEIVSFPINSMVIFRSYVRLPEGKDVYSHPQIDGKVVITINI